MRKNNNCGIYTITHTKTRNLYVGSSTNIENRIKQHARKLFYNSHVNHKLQNDFWLMCKSNFLNCNFCFEVYCICEEDLLQDTEQNVINSLLPYYNIDTVVQYNSNRNKKLINMKPEQYLQYLIENVNEDFYDNADKYNLYLKECRILREAQKEETIIFDHSILITDFLPTGNRSF